MGGPGVPSAGMRQVMDPKLMMLPLLASFMAGRTAWLRKKTCRRLVLMLKSQSSDVTFSVVSLALFPAAAALFTKIWTMPCLS